jgi:hypothetical protein
LKSLPNFFIHKTEYDTLDTKTTVDNVVCRLLLYLTRDPRYNQADKVEVNGADGTILYESVSNENSESEKVVEIRNPTCKLKALFW